jgi:hypothetical protein
MNDKYIVKMSRKFIAMLVIVGAIFDFVGLIMLILFITGSWTISNDKLIIFILFEIFSLVGGGSIVLSQIKNLIHPYTMLEIDENGLKFAIKANYELININWTQIESVEITPNTQLTVMGKYPVDNLMVKVKLDSGFPGSQATSSGLMYFNNTLIVDGLYMNKRAVDVETEINKHIH